MGMDELANQIQNYDINLEKERDSRNTGTDLQEDSLTLSKSRSVIEQRSRNHSRHATEQP